jgi:hypothetical protein
MGNELREFPIDEFHMKMNFDALTVTMHMNRWGEIKSHVDDLERNLAVAQEALQWASEMLMARDEMNSKVHCAPVRLSPITERVKQALTLINPKKEDT